MSPTQTVMEVDCDSKLNFASSSRSVPGIMYDFDPKCDQDIEDRKPIISRSGNLEDAKVDVVGCSNPASAAARWSDPQDPDATEYSSSFSGTVSDSNQCPGLSDGEVESEYLPPAFNIGMPYIRKKKLTNHWRNFIRPLMWRCKWTELRIKELESQALNYANAIAAYEQENQQELEHEPIEEFGSKSSPFYQRNSRRKIMKRKKRKRIEDTTDISSYMSNHNLFSFHENKMFDMEANFMDNEVNPSDKAGTSADNLGAIPEHSCLESRQIDVNLEQVLQKIEVVYSRVHKMRNQLDLIMSQNALKFSSSENLSHLLGAFEEAQTSSAPTPTFSAGNGDPQLMRNEQHNPNYDLDSLVLPESVVSSFDEVVSIPDVIESTVGLLCAANGTLQPKLEDTMVDIVDNILIHNEVAELGVTHILKCSMSEPTVNQQESDKGEQDESPDPLPQDVTLQQQSSIQSGLASDIHVPMNKRRRGERKSGNGGWNK